MCILGNGSTDDWYHVMDDTPIKVLLLDLDGTILDGSLVPTAILRTCHVVSMAHPNIDPFVLAEANVSAFNEIWEDRHQDWTLGKMSDLDFRLECWDLTLNPFGIHNPIETHSAVKLFDHFVRASYQAFEDVPDLVHAAIETEMKIGLVTNGASGVQRAKVDAIGLSEWFDEYAISGELGVAKPDKSIFEPLLERFMFEGKSVWHVGDSLEADVAGANNAGITSVWLNRHSEIRDIDSPTPDLEIASLRDLIQYLT